MATKRQLQRWLDECQAKKATLDSQLAACQSQRAVVVAERDDLRARVVDLAKRLEECQNAEPEPPPPTGGIILFDDPCTASNYEALWGESEAFPTMAVRDGRSVRRFRNGPGVVRNELGYNSRNPAMKTAHRFYDGDVKTTLLEFWLHDDYPLDGDGHQNICQWKQSGNAGDSPILSIRAMDRTLHLIHNDPVAKTQRAIWSVALNEGDLLKLIRLELEMGWSLDPNGWVVGTWKIGTTRSGTVNVQSIRTIHPWTDGAYPPQGHLRVGYYRHATYDVASGLDLGLARVLG